MVVNRVTLVLVLALVLLQAGNHDLSIPDLSRLDHRPGDFTEPILLLPVGKIEAIDIFAPGSQYAEWDAALHRLAIDDRGEMDVVAVNGIDGLSVREGDVHRGAGGERVAQRVQIRLSKSKDRQN